MGLIAVTGSASGIGAAIVQKLQFMGHRVITIDRAEAEIRVDLSEVTGRAAAIAAVKRAAPQGLDGLVPCAGLGPQAQAGLIPRVNYFGAVELVQGLREDLARARGSVVLISSNSVTMMPYDETYIGKLLEHDEAGACACCANFDGQSIYGGAKLALSRWMRRNNREYALAGIRMNVVAPGYTRTPLTRAVEQDPIFAEGIKAFLATIPVGRAGTPEDSAAMVGFLMGPEAGFVSGSVLFVDGGQDAMWRPDRF